MVATKKENATPHLLSRFTPASLSQAVFTYRLLPLGISSPPPILLKSCAVVRGEYLVCVLATYVDIRRHRLNMYTFQDEVRWKEFNQEYSSHLPINSSYLTNTTYSEDHR